MFISSLSKEQKQQALTNVELSLSNEIYRLCLFLGLDPDTFDPTQWEEPTPIMQHEQTLMTKACTAYAMVRSKLDELG